MVGRLWKEWLDGKDRSPWDTGLKASRDRAGAIVKWLGKAVFFWYFQVPAGNQQAFDFRSGSVRTPLIAGNWKMNLNRLESVALARAIAAAGVPKGVELVICPPAVYLDAVGDAVGKGGPGLGAQNCSAEPNGAFTGEISTSMLADLGCSHVIVGHSERRQLMGESDNAVNRKAKSVLAAGLVPVVCVGETLDEREAGDTEAVVRAQMAGSLSGIDLAGIVRVVVAYEPVWAIGTGRTASPAQAQEVHADLRKWLESGYNPEVAAKVRILYGGSVKAENAGDLLGQPDIDGALVGGASLNAAGFLAIARAAAGSSG